MTYQIDIDGQQADVWTRDFRVEYITLRTSTTTWTSGGGGYISAQYGGWVSAPQTHSKTTQYKEVRVVSGAGTRQTVSVSDDVTCAPGDDLTFVYASPLGAESGPLAGIVNHTERRWWSYPVTKLVGYRRERQAGYMILVVAITLCSFMTADRFVNWRIASLTTERAQVQKGLTDWDDFRRYNEKNRDKPISVKTFAALHRPAMDYSWSGQQYFTRFYEIVTSLRRWNESYVGAWILGLGFIAFLIAWSRFAARGSEVEAIGARRVMQELQAIASSRTGGGSQLASAQTRLSA